MERSRHFPPKRFPLLTFLAIAALALHRCGSPQPVPPPAPLPESFGTAQELLYLSRPDLLPLYRDDAPVAQFSSYDTTGGNNDGFSGLYSFLRKEGDRLVLADIRGPGVINRIWTPTPTEDTVLFYIDGEPEPRIRLRMIDLFSGEAFPFLQPLAGHELGGYYSYVPIAFRKSCVVHYCGTGIRFHQIQYRHYPPGSEVSPYPEHWTAADSSMLNQAREAWNLEADRAGLQAEHLYPDLQTVEKQLVLEPGRHGILAEFKEPGRIVGIELDPAEALAGSHKDLILQVYWDGEAIPAVNCPAADFFGYAFGRPAMQSLLLGTRDSGTYCHIPMPFEREARLQLYYLKRDEPGQPPLKIRSRVRYAPHGRNPDREGRFYAYRNPQLRPPEGKAFVFLDTQGRGHLVGVNLQCQGLLPEITRYFEGDDSTVIDGVLRLHGTGSEDYFNGGWYALPDRWDRALNLPVHGSLGYSIPYARTGGYRFYLSDKLSFERGILHTIEHGPEGNRYPVEYTSVAYYYADRGPASHPDPLPVSAVVFEPDTFVVLADLSRITLGLHISAEYRTWDRLVLRTREGGVARLLLDQLPEGRYRMQVTFFTGPEGGTCTLRQRQVVLSPGIDTRSDRNERVEIDAGSIRIDDRNNTLSFYVEPAAGTAELSIHKIVFIRQETQN
jgi:hypothetical protein